MPHYYTEAAREHETYALPDIEIFQAWNCECSEGCGGYDVQTEDPALSLATCEKCGAEYGSTEKGYFYQFCFPGCLPESEPSGPYPTEDAALEAAREAAGV